MSSSLLSPLQAQIRVVWALIRKEIRSQHRNEALGYLWAILEPMIHLLGWLVFITVFRQRAPIGSSPVTFLATGILPLKVFMGAYLAMTIAMVQNWQALNYALVRPNDTIIARFILAIATDILVMVIVFSILILTNLSEPPHDVLRAMEAMVLIIMVSFGYGLFSAYLMQVSPILEKITRLLSRVIYFLAGIFFIPDMLPQPLRDIVWYNPLAHGVEMFRSAYYPSFESRMPLPSYMIAWAAGLTLMGLMLSSVERAKSRYS